MADPESTIDNLNRTLQGSIEEIIKNLESTKVAGSTLYNERKQEAEILAKLGEDLKSFGDFSEGMDETVKEFEKIIKEFSKAQQKQEKQKGVSGADLAQRINEAQKINAKLDSVKKMNAYLGTQKRWHDSQISVLKDILSCCLKGSSMTSVSGTTTETASSTASEVSPRETSTSTFDPRSLEEAIERKIKGEKNVDFSKALKNVNDELKKSTEILKTTIFGDPSILKGVGKNLMEMSQSLMILNYNESLLGKLTKNTL